MKKVPGILHYCCFHKIDISAALSALLIASFITATILPWVSANETVNAGEGRTDHTESSPK